MDAFGAAEHLYPPTVQNRRRAAHRTAGWRQDGSAFHSEEQLVAVSHLSNGRDWLPEGTPKAWLTAGKGFAWQFRRFRPYAEPALATLVPERRRKGPSGQGRGRGLLPAPRQTV